jgi:hypothetical protein
LAANRAFAERLQSLSFARCYGVADATLAALDRFPHLTSLSLQSAFVTGSFLVALKESPGGPPPLQVLVVTGGFLEDATVAHLPAVFPQLRRLDLSGNAGITDASHAVFTKLVELDILKLDDTGVTQPVPIDGK